MTKKEYEMKSRKYEAEIQKLHDEVIALIMNRNELKERLAKLQGSNELLHNEINYLRVDVDNLVADKNKLLKSLLKLIDRL